jgi:hypothetical protein
MRGKKMSTISMEITPDLSDYMNMEPEIVYINENTPYSVRNIKKVYQKKNSLKPSIKLQKMMKVQKVFFIDEFHSFMKDADEGIVFFDGQGDSKICQELMSSAKEQGRESDIYMLDFS